MTKAKLTVDDKQQKPSESVSAAVKKEPNVSVIKEKFGAKELTELEVRHFVNEGCRIQ